MYTINTPKSINLDFLCVDNILKQHKEFSDLNDEKLHFDFSESTWIDADCTPFIGNLIHKAHDDKKLIYFSNLRGKPFSKILQKNGFLKKYGLAETISDDKNTTIPYKVLNAFNDDDIDSYLDDKVFSKIHQVVDENEIEIIRDAVFEVSHNIKDHSESTSLLICGQHYPQKKIITLTISDIGISIPQKVKSKFNSKKQEDDSTIIDWSTQSGNSTKNVASGGLGLYDIKTNLIGKGNFKIISGHGYWEQNFEGLLKMKLLTESFNGTLISITFFQDDHINRIPPQNHDIMEEEKIENIIDEFIF